MNYIIENDLVKVEITTKACEVLSFYDKELEIEYMWQGDATYWAGRNPILFPIVGTVWAKEYTVKNNVYKMGNHGFARHSEFSLIKQSENELVFELKDNEETYSQYPYHFSLIVKYKLEDKRLDIKYEIKNLDEEVMPFGFGLHPAFNTPMTNEDNYHDYKIVFEQKEEINLDGLKAEGFSLSHELFEKYPTIILDKLKSKYVTLTNNKYMVEVGIEGFDYLAFWTPNKAQFVCIEPWMSMTDFEENNLAFKDRLGMVNLNCDEIYEKEYYIKIGEVK